MGNSNTMGAAIVTGGRRGIGAAISVALAKAGFDVLIVDVEHDKDAEATLAAARAHGGTAEFCAADVSELESHDAILAAALALPSPLSCLVNNAGVTSLSRGDLLELTPESYDRVMRVNLRGAFFLSQAFAKRLVNAAFEGQFRSIINITSMNAEILSPDRADYAISKTGLSMMTRLFAARLAPHLIHAYEVRPGVIRTDMTAPVTAKYQKLIDDGGIPIARWGEPEDVGRAVAMLASGALPYSTGDALAVDGGIGMHRL
jgi:3-oxoacyl-[acyl-carrier protein] reductase